MYKLKLSVTGGLVAFAATQLAFGVNITIFDKLSGGSYFGAGPSGRGGEDQEVESGSLAAQKWDLEGFNLTGTRLTLTGGYDFRTGVSDGIRNYRPGDIFIDVNGDAKWGTDIFTTRGDGSNKRLSNADYKFDYVIDVEGASYSVYKLTDSSQAGSVYFRQNDESNPWRFIPGNEPKVAAGSVEYMSHLSNRQVGFMGDLNGPSHYTMSVDVGFLGPELESSLFKYTYECGNDNLIGRVPDTGNAGLLLLGVLAVGFLAHRSLATASHPGFAVCSRRRLHPTNAGSGQEDSRGRSPSDAS